MFNWNNFLIIGYKKETNWLSMKTITRFFEIVTFTN